MSKRHQSIRYLQTRDDVTQFCISFAKKNDLNIDRIEDLVDVIWDAIVISATGTISVRKATSLILRFFGNALDIV